MVSNKFYPCKLSLIFHCVIIALSVVLAIIVSPSSIITFSPFMQRGGIVFRGMNIIVHQNQVQASPFLLKPLFSISGAIKGIVVPLISCSSFILITSLPGFPQHFRFDALIISAIAEVPFGMAICSLI